ncbi:MAG: hypothetical protein FJ149_03945 [Euryarchaeota archaeon]|nr:hypothetical protein [Euryarchaeota archaeon]
MRKVAVLAVLALLLFQSLVPAARVDRFAGGGASATALLEAPGNQGTVNLTVPARCHVLAARLNVTGLASPSDPEAFPEDVVLRLGEAELWRFGGFGYGPLGRQDRFRDDKGSATATFGPGGGSGGATVRLPSNATVLSAAAELSCTGPVSTREVARLAGSGGGGDRFGTSAASAGDLNGDGFADFVVGAPFDDTDGTDAGRAFVFLGGPDMDGTPDIVLRSGSAGDLFGSSVAGAGDLNSDGYDDIVVGAKNKNAVNTSSGRAYVFLGGSPMDSLPDVLLDGFLAFEQLGTSVACAGDTNGDGYDDVLAGAPGIPGSAVDRGSAYLYFGGQAMDGQPDLCMTGAAAGDRFGLSVSGAGDLDGDGDGDFLVGAPFNDWVNTNAGAAYLFLGSPSMDPFAELHFYGMYLDQYVGWSVSGAGDIDRDGYDESLVGAPGYNGALPGGGGAYIYLGGPAISTDPDISFIGVVQGGAFGTSVSGGGDIDADGFSDILVGAPGDTTAGAGAGAAYAFLGDDSMDAQADLALRGGPGDGFGSAVALCGDIDGSGHSAILAGAGLADAAAADSGQACIYLRAPFLLSPALELGPATLWGFDGLAAGQRTVPDFAAALNSHLRATPPTSVDGAGNARTDVALTMRASGEGRMTLGALRIAYDYKAAVPDFSESLNGYIAAHQDGSDAAGNLTVPIAIRSATPGRVVLSGLELDLDEPPRATDDVPLLALDEDTANTALVDLSRFFGDDFDRPWELDFSVYSVEPAGIVAFSVANRRYLSADALTGGPNDNWTGRLRLRVACSDRWGQSTLSNTFEVVVRPVNDAPVFLDPPPTQAIGGMPFEQRLAVADAENDTLVFALEEAPAGMTLDPASGVLRWTPSVPGAYRVSVRVSDGELSSALNFTLVVTFINKAPRFISTPVKEATGGLRYVYESRAVDVDGDSLFFALPESPAGMTVDHATGRVEWTPGREVFGNFTVAIVASDGKGGEDRQTFTLTVSPFSAPAVSILRPAAGGTVSGSYMFSGTATRGTLEIVRVQVRIDQGGWLNATGNSSWGLLLDTSELKDGTHVLEARAYDGMVYSEPGSVRFRSENQEETDDTWSIAVAAVVIAGIAGAAVFLWWRGRRPKVYDWG